MTIRTILLGAAGLVTLAVGARAADAPVTMVEPKPVGYVRVCDVYGTGFFFIPGTETCLKIGGYVRARFQSNDGEVAGDVDDVDDDVVAGTRVRARLDFEAREETELGTLIGKIRLEATNSLSSNATYGVDEGFLQLGGLRIGTLDSLWTSDEGDIGDGLLMEEVDWAAGDFQTNRISYFRTVGGFTGVVGVEDDGTGDWRPDVIAKLAYANENAGLAAYVMGAFDEDARDVVFGYEDFLNEFRGVAPDGFFDDAIAFQPDGYDGNDDAFVLKAAVQFENVLLDDSIFKVEGHYAFDPSIYAVVSTLSGSEGFGEDAGGPGQVFDPSLLPSRFQVGAAYSQEMDRFTFILSGVYGETDDLDVFYSNLPGRVFDGVGSQDYFGVGGNVVYDLAENFTITGEVTYRDIDLPAGIDDFDRTAGLLQFRRDF